MSELYLVNSVCRDKNYFYRTKEDNPSVCKWNIIEVSFYFCGSNQNRLNLFYYLSEGGCQILADMCPNREYQESIELLYEKNLIQYLNCFKTSKAELLDCLWDYILKMFQFRNVIFLYFFKIKTQKQDICKPYLV